MSHCSSDPNCDLGVNCPDRKNFVPFEMGQEALVNTGPSEAQEKGEDVNTRKAMLLPDAMGSEETRHLLSMVGEGAKVITLTQEFQDTALMRTPTGLKPAPITKEARWVSEWEVSE